MKDKIIKRYFVVDLFGNEYQISKLEYYISLSIWWIIPIAGVLALVAILKDTFS